MCKEVNDIIALGYLLPSGLDDPQAAEKMLAEQQELLDALAAGDREGALTEAADAVYYACKHLDWVAGRLDLDIADLFRLSQAKYELRARPGNPKDDAAERAACAAAIR